MCKKDFMKILAAFGEGLVIAGIVLFVMSPVSCKVTAEGIKLISGDYTPPSLEEFVVMDEKNLMIVFSEGVNLTGCVVSDVSNVDYKSMVHSNTMELSLNLRAASGEFGKLDCSYVLEDENKQVHIILENGTEIGKEYEVYGIVKDLAGNSMTFALPFTGFNPRIPRILMTEIQTVSMSSQTTKEKAAGTYRNEFVEFMALSEGNLFGVELVSGYDGESKKFVFPNVEVSAGEIFVVHLRNRGEGCISELGEDLNLAFGGYTKPEIRDLWAAETGTVLGNKTDVIIVRASSEGKLLDGVMYRQNTVDGWNKNLEPYAELLVENGICSFAGIENAIDVSDMSDSKTLQRVNVMDLKLKIERGEKIDYPVLFESLNWDVGTETAGAVNTL